MKENSKIMFGKEKGCMYNQMGLGTLESFLMIKKMEVEYKFIKHINIKEVI